MHLEATASISLIVNSIVIGAPQIPKDPFNSCPMIFLYIFHIPTHNSHCICNIWPHIHHFIHDSTNRTSMWLFLCLVFLLFFVRTHVSQQTHFKLRWSVSQFTCIHPKELEHVLHILPLDDIQLPILVAYFHLNSQIVQLE